MTFKFQNGKWTDENGKVVDMEKKLGKERYDKFKEHMQDMSEASKDVGLTGNEAKIDTKFVLENFARMTKAQLIERCTLLAESERDSRREYLNVLEKLRAMADIRHELELEIRTGNEALAALQKHSDSLNSGLTHVLRTVKIIKAAVNAHLIEGEDQIAYERTANRN